MAYTTNTNNRILDFINKAQTKIGRTSILVSDKVSEDSRYETYRDELDIAYGLLSFIRSLDNIFNDWTEPEIIKYMDKWTAKANLNPIPYINRTFFNNRISFIGGSIPGGGGSGTWILSTGFWDDGGVWDDTAVWVD